MTVEPSVTLVVVLAALVAIALAASRLGDLGQGRAMFVAAVRAVVQLAVVSLIIVVAIRQVWSSTVVVVAMFAVAVWTTTGRTGTRRRWQWAAVAMLAGMVPTLLLVFVSGAAPLNGYALIPIAGIIIGGAMTVHTLTGRRLFDELRAQQPNYEAGLSVGLTRPEAIAMVTEPRAAEGLLPGLDQTRTVGLVTLPGAFVGVLLGGGTALHAGAAQVLVLFGLLATQSVTVVVAHRLICAARLLPDDLAATLIE